MVKEGDGLASIPKPASTVVLMNEEGKIYLTKRPETMKFLGGYYVFPGGAVEAGDEQVPNEYIKKCEESLSFPLAHFIAAARELFEEVGIFITVQDVEGITWKGNPFEYRKQLIAHKLQIGEILQLEGKILALNKFTYFGHFITPKLSPIRYDTRFFLTKLPKGQEPLPDQREIAEAFWITPEEALKAYERKEIQLVPPTILSLQAILNYQQGKPLEMPKNTLLSNNFPFV